MSTAPPPLVPPVPAPRTTIAGQKIDDNFVDSILSCYTNLSMHPVALTVLCVAIFCVMAELVGDDGPLEGLLEIFTKAFNDKSHNSFVRGISNIFVFALKFLVGNKKYMLPVAFMWVPVICKPSKRNIIMAALLSMLVFAKAYSTVELLFFGQLWFLFTALRNPTHKMIIFFAGLGIFVYEMIDINKTITVGKNVIESHREGKASRITVPAAETKFVPPPPAAKTS